MKTLFLSSNNELEAFHKAFIELFESEENPSDEELIKESMLSLLINNSDVSNRIKISNESFSTQENYNAFTHNGNEIVQIECDYWGEELFLKGRVQFLIKYLQEHPESKRAIANLWDERHSDLDFPAACMTYVYCRIDKGALNMACHFRANDGYKNLLIDLDILRATQKYIAETLHLNVGTYLHTVDSFHLYQVSKDQVNRLYKELKQSNNA